VQEKHTEYGFDPKWCDDTVWIDTEDGCNIVEAPVDGEETDTVFKTGFKDRWETVMVAFTEEGCKDYLRQNGHNHGKTRIYVESFRRCDEMIAIRKMLMEAV
jgi:hypothetical protein